MKTVYDVTRQRVGLALLAGAAVGALVAFVSLAASILLVLGATSPDAWSTVGRLLPAVVLRGFLTWLLGLLMIGAPAWWLLHRHGWRGWRAAILAAAALAFVTSLLLAIPRPGQHRTEADRGGLTMIDDSLTAHGWSKATLDAAFTALAGAAVGFTVWRTAYRRQDH
jgi:hypothetical protein